MTVVGTPESQWKAQYLIFEKLREEGFAAGQDDVRLTVEILVPAAQVDSRHIQTPQVHMYIQTSVTGGKNHREGRTKCERNAATDWSHNKTTGTGWLFHSILFVCGTYFDINCSLEKFNHMISGRLFTLVFTSLCDTLLPPLGLN